MPVGSRWPLEAAEPPLLCDCFSPVLDAILERWHVREDSHSLRVLLPTWQSILDTAQDAAEGRDCSRLLLRVMTSYCREIVNVGVS